MRTEKLRFEHREVLYEPLRKIHSPIAEYSFANIYLFRREHEYEVIFDGELFIRGVSYDGHPYIMPTVEVHAIDIDHLKDRMRGVDFLFPIPEDWLGYFNADEFQFSYKKGDMDYVYTVEKMVTYTGRRLHKKRNLLKQFLAEYKHEARPLTNDLLEDARFILNEWQAEAGADKSEADYYPCLEALDLYEALILCGGIYYVDGEPAGFILGEELNDETFVLHFAKARTKFKGIYQYMYNNFAYILPPKYRFLNFEQDLDKSVLRTAKSSYVPDTMVKKVRVSLKK